MKRTKASIVFKIWLAVLLVVLALPIVSMVVLSFNESRYGTLPFKFSLDWYSTLAADSALLDSLGVSLSLATDVALICVVVGTLLVFGLRKASIAIKTPVNVLLLAILTVPALIFSAGLVAVFTWMGLQQSTLALLLASAVTSLPFVVLIESGHLQNLSQDYAEAALTLGAGPLRTFLTVTVPLMAPSILAGGMLAFVICFNNFAIQLFLAPIGTSTLPVQIYSMVRLGVTPDVNALGTLIVVGTALLIGVLNWLTGNAARLFTTTPREP
ncbi:ABC transporter permease [Paenarthrobacter sp. NPDC058040]|uniref:ABC transporter permease n=1 Tax=unclassified Paenarthrobacter TaxID=2634190 RepID=UPI0036DCFE26